MDVNDVLTALNGVLDLGDTLDSTGIGIKVISEGKHTTREVCQTELGHFLLYIGDGAPSFTEAQAALVNIVLNSVYGQIPTWQMKSVASSLDIPDPKSNATFSAFEIADEAIAKQNGTPTTKLRDLLINLYESFGGLMVSFNDNFVSRSRYNTYMTAMRARKYTDQSILDSKPAKTAASGSGAGYTAPSGSPGSGDNVDVSQYIPAGISLTDLQKEYLRVIIKYINRDGYAYADTVASEMKKTPSAVRSAAGTLRKKKILDLDEYGRIILAAPTNKAMPKTKKDSSISRYDERISFSLPAGYEFSDEKDDDGKRSAKINVNPQTDDDGDLVYENTFILNVLSPDGVNAGKSALDVMHENNKNAVVNKYLTGEPKALLIISSSSSNLFGMQLNVTLVNLAVALSRTEAFSITCVNTKVGNEDDDSLQLKLDQLKIVWDSMIINGQRVKTADMNYNSLQSAVTEKAAADREKGKTHIDNQVRVVDGYVEIGNRWHMELPYGIRARCKPAEDDRFDELNFELDRRLIGYCNLADTIYDQEEAAQSILSMLAFHNELNKIMEEDLRNDDIMEVKICQYISFNSSGKSAFLIEIIEKQPESIITRIVLMPPTDIENPIEALEKIKNREASLNHPFGDEWEMYWRTALRMAASISPVDGKKETIRLAPPVTVDENFTIQIPDRCKPIRVKENNKVAYFPTSKKLTQADLKKRADYPYYIAQETGDMTQVINSLNAESPEMLAIQIRQVANMLERGGRDPFAVSIHESMTDAGYKAIYMVRNGDAFYPDVLMLTTDGKFMNCIFNTDSGYSPDKLLQIARVFFDGVHYNNDREIVPVAYPQVPDNCHEHLTLVMSGTYTTRRDADFVGQPVRMLMEKYDSTSDAAYDMMIIPDDDYSLDVEARRLATVFRLEENLFDPYKDTEAMIRIGMFENVRMFHALRAFAWTVFCMADREGRKLDSYSFEELKRISEPIEKNHFNYSTESYCSGLCSHYDWRVFYVPDSYIDSDYSDSTDLRLLCGKENRSGNSSFVFIPGVMGGPSSINRTNNIISRNEETLESLEALRKDLIDLLPVMRTVYDGFMKDRDRSEKLEGVLAEALIAWCALSIAAKEAFYSEEAVDSYEADAGLDGPLERPTDIPDDQPVKAGKSTASRPSAAEKPPKPAGDILDLGGETIIKPGQFAGNMTLKNIVIPEGVTEIGDRAFYSCMFLETVILPKSLRKIDQFAFMSCRNLRKVELQEGVEEMESHAFGATNNLKQVHLPDSLKKVDRYIFGMGGDSPYATAYMSGALACRLMEECNKDKSWPSDAVYARHYVIDGVGYENMTDFWKKVRDGSIRVEQTKPAAKSKPAPAQQKKPVENIAEQIPEEEEMRESAKQRHREMEYRLKAIKGRYENKPPVSTLSALKKENPDIDWQDIQQYLPKQIGKNATDYFKEAGLIKTGKSKDQPAPEAKPEAAENTVDDTAEWTPELWNRTVIEEYEFANDRHTGVIVVPEGVTDIRRGAFSGAAMHSVRLPGSLRKVWTGAFQNCRNLTRVDFPEGVEHIEYYVFGECENMADVYLPDSIIYVGPSALRMESFNKESDSRITLHMSGELARKLHGSRYDHEIVAHALLIDEKPYKSMAEYIRKWKEEEKKARQAEQEKTKAAKTASAQKWASHTDAEAGDIAENGIRFNVLRDKGPVIEERKYTFLEDRYLEIPEGVTEIQSGAFFYGKFEIVKLPSSLRTIGAGAFDNCFKLRKVIIPEGVREMESVIFGGDKELRELHLPGSLQKVRIDTFSQKGLSRESNITVYLSGLTAEKLNENREPYKIEVAFAECFVIDGKRYSTITEYIRAKSTASQPFVKKTVAQPVMTAAEKERERNAIRQKIAEMEKERDSARGLLGGLKRMKLQKMINDLKDRLGRI